MSPLTRILGPLRQAAAAFFRHEVALTRGDRGMQFVLRESARGGGKNGGPNRSELAAQKDAAELKLMLEQLQALLAELPQARQTLRALVFVEHALHKKGLRAFRKLPLEVLQRALEQLEGLVTNWSPEGLANLRSKMAVAIIDREHMDTDAEAEAYRTAGVLDTASDELPLTDGQPGSDDAELAAAYAALGALSPASAPVETQGELGSPSARAALRPPSRPTEGAVENRLRELQG